MTNSLPSGTVTFLFTDIEGSTKLAQEHPDKWETLQRRHHAILQSAMDAHNGYVFQIIGDAFCVAFNTANEAILSAIKSQTDLHAEHWGAAPIKVRMGIHTGQAQIKDKGDYQGYLSMSRVQRLMSAGHGGQILISMATQELIRDELPENISLRDMGERRLKDLIRPKHIYQLDIADLPVEFPALKTLDKYRHNLPTQMTSFIGREKEMVEIKQALAEHRLITLTGSGGAGKTRLSLQVAADALDQFPNGIWFVELAPLTDPDLIPQTILTTAEMQTQQGKSALESLTDFLREKTSLLVLDNCEHLIDACAKIADTLLNAAPNLKILASSREALDIRGEQSWRVPSLSAPDVKHLPSLEQLSQYEAVRLFIDRALLTQPHFVITNDNAPSVAQICYQLDGIPLAIELAAARLRMLSVKQIAARLDDRFRLLTGGSRTALPRQQTLRALIDWSYDLLFENERILLRRLAVFSGGCTLEAVEQVCASTEYDVLDLLSHLVDKSLLVVEEQSDQLRYRILESVRQYAREKLLEAGEGEQIREQHLDYFLKLALKSEPQLYTAKQLETIGILEDEHNNFQAALEWSLENDVDNGQALVVALWWSWEIRGYVSEGWRWIRKALSARPDTPTVMQAKLLSAAGWMVQNAIDRGAFAEKSVALFRETNDKVGLAFSLTMAGAYVSMASDFVQASVMIEEGRRLFAEAGNKWGVRNALCALGDIYTLKGDFKKSESLFRESLALSRELGDVDGIQVSLLGLGWSIEEQGEHSEAIDICMEGLSYAKTSKTKRNMATILNLMGVAAFQMGSYALSRDYLEEALSLCREMGDQEGVLRANRTLGKIALAERDYVKARYFALECLKLSQKLEDIAYIALSLIMFGQIIQVKGYPENFVRLLGNAEKIVHFDLWETVSHSSRNQIKQAVESARAALGEETYNAAYASGRAMTMDEDIEYALKSLQVE